ncbi:MAG: sensor histidine kinase [Nocardioidaceae bacterium]
MVLSVGFAMVVASATPGFSSVSADVARTGRAVAAAMFTASGVLALARGYIASESATALRGLALLLLGLVAWPLIGVIRTMSSQQPDSLLPDLVRGAVTTVVLWLLAYALRCASHNKIVNLSPIATCTGIAALVIEAVALVSVGGLHLSAHGGRPAHVLLAAVVATEWLAVALWTRAASDRVPWAPSVWPLLLAMGIAEVLRGFGDGRSDTWIMAAASIGATIGAISAWSALIELGRSTREQRAQLDLVSQDLVRARYEASATDAWRQELRHDVRNSLTGMRGALLTLRSRQAELDAGMTERLREAVLGEVSHLEHLILRQDAEATVDFEVGAVVSAVIEARSAAGLDVTLAGPAARRAHGRPGDLATVLQNLLVNVQEHADGRAEVNLSLNGDRVQILVCDDGPGVPDDQIERLFERGARGPESRGSGLGLHVARTLMRQQGGDLMLLTHRGGCTFAVLLPAAADQVCGNAFSAHRHLEGIAVADQRREGQANADEPETSAAGR